MSSETSRVEAFSDGVFAIAITLLILDVRVPSATQPNLRQALLRQWPMYVAFLISFAFIGIMWVNHHRLFNHIRRTDNGLMFLNLLLLLGVTFVPFPTALLAAHYYSPGRTVAAAVFNGTYFVIAIFFNVLWHHVVRSNLPDLAVQESANAITRQYAVGPVSYLLCFGLTWVSVPLSLAANIGLAIFFAMPPKLAPEKRPPMHSATK
jgi:TMEM175 potassium channel family protein